MSTALTRIEGGQMAERPTFDLAEVQQLGQIFVKSGFFQDSKDASQAIVKIMAGAELGIGPMASMTGVYIVKGKVSLSANLMAAAVKRSRRYDYKIRAHNAEVCRIEFFDGKESLGVSEFTMKEAKEAKLHQDYDKEKKEWKDKPTWKNFPKNMLFSRSMSNGVKWFCPEVTCGPVYTPDELNIEENEQGEPMIQTAKPALEPKNVTPKTSPVSVEPGFSAADELRKNLEACWPKDEPGFDDWFAAEASGRTVEDIKAQFKGLKVAEIRAKLAKLSREPQLVEADPREPLIADIEAQMKQMEALGLAPDQVGKVAMGYTKGEAIEDLDYQALRQLNESLAGDIRELTPEAA